MKRRTMILLAALAALCSGPAFALEEMTILGFPYQPEGYDLPAGVGGGLSSLAFSADGSKAYTITTDNYEGNYLYALDPVTGEGTRIAQVEGDDHINDLAMQPGTGVLYGWYWGTLETVNTSDATVTEIGGLGELRIGNAGLAFAPDGTLYLASSALYELDPSNSNVLSTTSFDTEISFMGLGAHPMTGVLYGASRSSLGDIYAIDPDTGETTMVGSVTCPEGGTCYLHDLDFNPITGVMYGVMGGAGGSEDPADLPGAFVRWGLEISNNVTQAVSSQRNTPAAGAAEVIDSNTTLYMLFAGLGDDRDISDAVSQSLPLLIGSGKVAAHNVAGSSGNIIKARNRYKSGMSSGDSFIGDKNVWLKPFSTWSSQDDSNGAVGFDADAYGFVFGVDADTSVVDTLGLSFTYADSDVDSDSNIVRHNADIESYLFSLYGSHALNDRTDLTFQAGIGFHETDGTRNILFMNSIANSSNDSDSYHIGAGITRKYRLDEKTLFSPSIYADYSYIEEDGYTETGAGILNLTVNSEDTEALVTTFDALVAREISEKHTVTANLGVGYDLINENSTITSAYAAAPTAVFATRGIDPSAWSAHGGLGVVCNVTEMLSLNVNYDVELKDDFDSHTISAKLSYAF